MKPGRGVPRTLPHANRSPEPPLPMLLLQWIARSVVLALLTKLLGSFLPIFRRLFRLVWR